MGWTIGVLGFDSRRGLGIFLFTIASRTALGPTQPPIQWVPGALSRGIKRPGREADHSPPSSAEVKEWVELYLHSPNTPTWRAQLKHRENFTFTLFILNDKCDQINFGQTYKAYYCDTILTLGEVSKARCFRRIKIFYCGWPFLP
jgi:hypothetical protein